MPAAEENRISSPGFAKAVGEKQYEFKAEENKIIGQLAWRMNFVGVFLLAMGLMVIAIGIVPKDRLVAHIGPIISGTLTCLVGIWTQRASTSFRNVVHTEGSDISHLMHALQDLRKLYSLQFWLFIIGLILALAGLWAVSMGYVELIE